MENEFCNKTVRESLDIFKLKIEVLIEKYIPLSKPRDYNEPWMKGKHMKLWKNKYFAWERYTETKGYQKYLDYKRETNLINSSNIGHIETYLDQDDAPSPITPKSFRLQIDWLPKSSLSRRYLPSSETLMQ